MITPDMRPRLAAKARLRFDARTNRHLLLYPEKGMQLNGTAADIVRLCTGEHTVAAIVSELAAKYDSQPRASIEREVNSFLSALAERQLIEDDAGKSP